MLCNFTVKSIVFHVLVRILFQAFRNFFSIIIRSMPDARLAVHSFTSVLTSLLTRFVITRKRFEDQLVCAGVTVVKNVLQSSSKMGTTIWPLTSTSLHLIESFSTTGR